eukprot:2010946-Amphidinium_carterae.1
MVLCVLVEVDVVGPVEGPKVGPMDGPKDGVLVEELVPVVLDLDTELAVVEVLVKEPVVEVDAFLDVL